MGTIGALDGPDDNWRECDFPRLSKTEGNGGQKNIEIQSQLGRLGNQQTGREIVFFFNSIDWNQAESWSLWMPRIVSSFSEKTSQLHPSQASMMIASSVGKKPAVIYPVVVEKVQEVKTLESGAGSFLSLGRISSCSLGPLITILKSLVERCFLVLDSTLV